MMKWKPNKTDTYVIVQAFEGQGKFEGTLGSLLVEGSEGTRFLVGSFKITDGERAYLWSIRDQLPGKRATIRYTELSSRGKPPSSVFITLVE